MEIETNQGHSTEASMGAKLRAPVFQCSSV